MLATVRICIYNINIYIYIPIYVCTSIKSISHVLAFPYLYAPATFHVRSFNYLAVSMTAIVGVVALVNTISILINVSVLAASFVFVFDHTAFAS